MVRGRDPRIRLSVRRGRTSGTLTGVISHRRLTALKVVGMLLVVGGLIVYVGFLLMAPFLALALLPGLLEPPKPDRRLVPEVIGVVIRWDYVEGACALRQITLAGGETLELRLLSSVRCGEGPWETGVPQVSGSMFYIAGSDPGSYIVSGGLLYYGHDEHGEWIAGALSNATAAASYARACPYILRGSGYDEGTVLHFSSGLVVEKAPGFQDEDPWDDTRIFRDADTICVNREGKAVSLRRYAPY